MSIRVTDAEVKEIIDTSLSTKPFIKVASLMVDQHLVDQGLSEDLLKEIERWLAAHFTAVRDQLIKSEETLDAKVTYQVGQSGKGIESTSYGQQAISLDSSGKLAGLSKKPATFAVVDFSLE